MEADDAIDKEAYVGLYATSLSLAIFFNIVLIVLVLWPFNRHTALWPFNKLLLVCKFNQHPVVTVRSPKHVLMVAVGVSQLLTSLLHHLPVLHFYSARDGTLPPPVDCSAVVTTELSSYLFPTITRLLVGSVLVTELLTLSKVTSRCCDVNGMMTSLILIVTSVAYGLVVVVPVFFFLYLESASEPCFSGVTILRYTSDTASGKAMSVVSYVIPVVVIATSLVTYVIIRFFCSGRQGKPVGVSSGNGFKTGNGSTPPYYISPSFGEKQKTQNGVNGHGLGARGDQSYSDSDSNSYEKPSSSFPYDTATVAVCVVFLELLFCLRQFAYWGQAKGDNRLFTRREWVQLWAVDRFLSLTSLSIVPVCWFFDPYIRAFFSPCLNFLSLGLLNSESAAAEERNTLARNPPFHYVRNTHDSDGTRSDISILGPISKPVAIHPKPESGGFETEHIYQNIHMNGNNSPMNSPSNNSEEREDRLYGNGPLTNWNRSHYKDSGSSPTYNEGAVLRGLGLVGNGGGFSSENGGFGSGNRGFSKENGGFSNGRDGQEGLGKRSSSTRKREWEDENWEDGDDEWADIDDDNDNEGDDAGFTGVNEWRKELGRGSRGANWDRNDERGYPSHMQLNGNSPHRFPHSSRNSRNNNRNSSSGSNNDRSSNSNNINNNNRNSNSNNSSINNNSSNNNSTNNNNTARPSNNRPPPLPPLPPMSNRSQTTLVNNSNSKQASQVNHTRSPTNAFSRSNSSHQAPRLSEGLEDFNQGSRSRSQEPSRNYYEANNLNQTQKLSETERLEDFNQRSRSRSQGETSRNSYEPSRPAMGAHAKRSKSHTRENEEEILNERRPSRKDQMPRSRSEESKHREARSSQPGVHSEVDRRKLDHHGDADHGRVNLDHHGFDNSDRRQLNHQRGFDNNDNTDYAQADGMRRSRRQVSDRHASVNNGEPDLRRPRSGEVNPDRPTFPLERQGGGQVFFVPRRGPSGVGPGGVLGPGGVGHSGIGPGGVGPDGVGLGGIGPGGVGPGGIGHSGVLSGGVGHSGIGPGGVGGIVPGGIGHSGVLSGGVGPSGIGPAGVGPGGVGPGGVGQGGIGRGGVGPGGISYPIKDADNTRPFLTHDRQQRNRPLSSERDGYSSEGNARNYDEQNLRVKNNDYPNQARSPNERYSHTSGDGWGPRVESNDGHLDEQGLLKPADPADLYYSNPPHDLYSKSPNGRMTSQPKEASRLPDVNLTSYATGTKPQRGPSENRRGVEQQSSNPNQEQRGEQHSPNCSPNRRNLNSPERQSRNTNRNGTEGFDRNVYESQINQPQFGENGGRDPYNLGPYGERLNRNGYGEGLERNDLREGANQNGYRDRNGYGKGLSQNRYGEGLNRDGYEEGPNRNGYGEVPNRDGYGRAQTRNGFGGGEPNQNRYKKDQTGFSPGSENRLGVHGPTTGIVNPTRQNGAIEDSNAIPRDGNEFGARRYQNDYTAMPGFEANNATDQYSRPDERGFSDRKMASLAGESKPWYGDTGNVDGDRHYPHGDPHSAHGYPHYPHEIQGFARDPHGGPHYSHGIQGFARDPLTERRHGQSEGRLFGEYHESEC